MCSSSPKRRRNSRQAGLYEYAETVAIAMNAETKLRELNRYIALALERVGQSFSPLYLYWTRVGMHAFFILWNTKLENGNALVLSVRVTGYIITNSTAWELGMTIFDWGVSDLLSFAVILSMINLKNIFWLLNENRYTNLLPRNLYALVQNQYLLI